MDNFFDFQKDCREWSRFAAKIIFYSEGVEMDKLYEDLWTGT